MNQNNNSSESSLEDDQVNFTDGFGIFLSFIFILLFISITVIHGVGIIQQEQSDLKQSTLDKETMQDREQSDPNLSRIFHY